ncbi:MAG: chloride channel protein [Caulobacteraceae bacterium]
MTVNRSVELSGSFWLMLVLTGVGAGLVGGLLMRLLYGVQHLAWGEGPAGLFAALLGASPSHKLLVLTMAGLIVAGGGLLLGSVKGGHAGELSVAIWFHAGGMPLVRTLGRAVLSIVIVAMGAAVGREGALKQAGAVIGWRWAHLAGLSPEQRRLLTACGAGAGMAAAYNIPLGGALFAMEVLLGAISLPFAVPAIACSVLATATSWLLLPMHPAYATPAYVLSLNQIGWALVVGPVIGGVSVLYVHLIAWADLHQPKGLPSRLLAPVAVFLALGAAAIAFPELLGNGKDVVQMAFDGGHGDAALSSPWLLLALVPMRAVATALCLRIGAPGGLFTPTMACGAVLGGSLGQVWSRLFPGDAQGSYAVIGSGAFLAAASEGPVSAVVTVVELGQTVSLLIVPLLVAVAGATLVMRICDAPSIYSARLRRGAQRAAEPAVTPPGAFTDLVSDDFTTISAAANPAIALQQLIALQDGPNPRVLYVIDEKGRLAGRISPNAIRQRDDVRRPIEMSTASDLAEGIDAVTSGVSRKQALDQLARSNEAELPVVSPLTGEFTGILRRASTNGLG